MNFKITFNMDGSGAYYDENEPIHLDSLLTYAVVSIYGFVELTRDEEPDDIQIPLNKAIYNGQEIWRASALFPDGDAAETIRFWRKKFNLDRLHKTKGSPNVGSGIYREYNMPMPMTLCNRFIAYANGDMQKTTELLKNNITSLGKKRSYGNGRINSIDAEPIEEDLSFFINGRAARHLPYEGGFRVCRVKPPYWNNFNAIKVCEIGDELI